MKDKKRFIIVFAIFWIIGLLGGYYLGVGSSMLPNESIEYNYFFSEKSSESSVEPVKHNCSENASANAESDDSNSTYLEVIADRVGVSELPHHLLNWIIPKS